jgi:4-hydroxy-tetrahydrodipicolinate synthase
MFNEWEKGNISKARKLHYKLEPLNSAMFIETNPIPVKTALALMGRIQEEFILPLCEMSPANKEKLKGILKNAGLI